MLLLLAVCLVCLLSCAPLTVKPRQVHYELGLGNADQIVVLAQAGPAVSSDFGLFFQTFSDEFENWWKQHCPEVRCLSNPWQITLIAAQAEMLFIHLDERSAGYPNFHVRKFSVQFPLQSIRNILTFAKRIVRTVIDILFRSQGNPIYFTAVSPRETPLQAAVEEAAQIKTSGSMVREQCNSNLVEDLFLGEGLNGGPSPLIEDTTYDSSNAERSAVLDR